MKNWAKGVFDFIKKTDPQKNFDTIAKGIDNLNLTTQEAADKTAALATQWIDENSIRSQYRRDVGLTIIRFTLSIVALCIGLYVLSDIQIQPIVDICLAFYIPQAFLTVLAALYGGYYLVTGKKKK